MAVKTGRAVIGVVLHLTVLIIHFTLTVFMAINAFKTGELIGVHMTIRTGVPFTLMFAGINWKILRVMIEIRRRPAAGAMAVTAVAWESRGRMIGIGGCVIITFVAGNAFDWRIAEATAVAFVTAY